MVTLAYILLHPPEETEENWGVSELNYSWKSSRRWVKICLKFGDIFPWILCLGSWGLLSVSIFSNSLNVFFVSKFSISCIFCFGGRFCLFSIFFFWNGSCIGDLLLFLVLFGDFVFKCLVDWEDTLGLFSLFSVVFAVIFLFVVRGSINLLESLCVYLCFCLLHRSYSIFFFFFFSYLIMPRFWVEIFSKYCLYRVLRANIVQNTFKQNL